MNKLKKIAMLSAVIPMLVACSANTGSNHKTTKASDTQKTEKVQTGPKSNKPKDLAEHYDAAVPSYSIPEGAKTGDIIKVKVTTADGKTQEVEAQVGSIYNDADGNLHYTDKAGAEQVIKK